MDKDLIYKIAITQIEGIGSILAKNLVDYCGGVKEVFDKREKELAKIPGIGTINARKIKEDSVFYQAKNILKNIKERGTKTLFYLDDDFPGRLKNHSDAPILLYTEGTNTYNNSRTLGIVGTRNATVRGKVFLEELLRGLKKYDITVISGLAFGIDAHAHGICVENDIPNIAVLGNGFDITYPSQHESLRKKIAKNGDIISEFPMSIKPDKGHFPMRNRIIAGLSDALLVVESDTKGGSMITAKMAFNYNKDVFAIPGRIDDRFSRGTNLLIKSNIASLIENADDIAKMMNWRKLGTPNAVQMQLFNELSKEEKLIIEILKDTELDSLSIDRIHYASNLPSGQLASLLLQLEFKGIIENLPGSRYMLLPEYNR